MPDEIIEIIDSAGKTVGKKTRKEVHEKGLLHRASHIFVLNGEGKIFIQQRSASRKIGPLLWDMSVAEHLKSGESYEEGALRGVKEELGVEAIDLEKIGETMVDLREGALIDREKTWVFKCKFKWEIKLDEEEVAQGRWISKQDLLNEMAYNSENFAPWLLQDKKFFEKL